MRRNGMTLVEVMVATAVLALVGSVVWAGFAQTSRNKREIISRADHDQKIRVALGRMQRELSMAYTSTHLNANPALRPMLTAFVGTDRDGRDRIDFTSFSHTPLYRDAKESDQHELSYFIARHPDDTKEWVLARRQQTRLDDQPTQGGVVQILLDGIEAFDLEYLDPQDWEWKRSWNADPNSGREANRLPAQVRITLTMTEERTYRTVAQLPLTWALNHASYE